MGLRITSHKPTSTVIALYSTWTTAITKMKMWSWWRPSCDITWTFPCNPAKFSLAHQKSQESSHTLWFHSSEKVLGEIYAYEHERHFSSNVGHMGCKTDEDSLKVRVYHKTSDSGAPHTLIYTFKWTDLVGYGYEKKMYFRSNGASLDIMWDWSGFSRSIPLSGQVTINPHTHWYILSSQKLSTAYINFCVMLEMWNWWGFSRKKYYRRTSNSSCWR